MSYAANKQNFWFSFHKDISSEITLNQCIKYLTNTKKNIINLITSFNICYYSRLPLYEREKINILKKKTSKHRR